MFFLKMVSVVFFIKESLWNVWNNPYFFKQILNNTLVSRGGTSDDWNWSHDVSSGSVVMVKSGEMFLESKEKCWNIHGAFKLEAYVKDKLDEIQSSFLGREHHFEIGAFSCSNIMCSGSLVMCINYWICELYFSLRSSIIIFQNYNIISWWRICL
jgi:hypothetical protein